MTFTELLAAVRANPNEVVIPPVWGQGRASFGGLVAALVFDVMRAAVAEGLDGGAAEGGVHGS